MTGLTHEGRIVLGTGNRASWTDGAVHYIVVDRYADPTPATLGIHTNTAFWLSESEIRLTRNTESG